MAIIETGIEAGPPRPFWQRLAWMIGIWAASILALGIVAGIMRYWLVG